MKLSIIILNYRSWEKASKCIDSIFQNPPKFDFEVILVDNDSQDCYIDIFRKEYPLVKIIENIGNYGYSSGCNYGAKFAIGKFLLFLNPDTEINSSKTIERLISYAEEDPKSGIVSCRKIKPRNRIEREITFLNPWLTIGIFRSIYKIVFFNKIKKKYPINQSIWHPEWVTGSIFLIKNEVFKSINGLAENDYWMYFEEMDLAQRIKLLNKSITLIRDIEIIHQHGGSSRINKEISALTKSEVMISRHVYISKFYHGFNGISLHAFLIFTGILSHFIFTLLTLPFFWTTYSGVRRKLLLLSTNYYLNAIKKGTWRSSLLEKQ